MENQSSDPIKDTLKKFKALPFGKKAALVATCLVLSFVVFFTFNLIGTSTGLKNSSLGSPMLPTVSPSAERYSDYDPVNSNMPMIPPTVTGTDAENFETRNLTANFETSNLSETCRKISSLKQKAEVIFLSENMYDTGCSYSFKVTNKEAEGILQQLKDLEPKEISEQTYTIKRQIENSLNQRDILTQNLTSSEAILKEALTAYDNLLTTAALQQNATALATAINDKINLIDRLTLRQEQTMQAIDSLNQQLAEQTDQLEYTYFSISVIERVYFDSKQIADSWKYALKQTVSSINEIVQQITLGLLTFIMYTLLYAFYLMIVLIIAKFGWRIVRTIWQK